MAAISYNQLLTRYQTWLRDATQATYTLAEQKENLNAAINDPDCAIVDRDTSNTVVAGQNSYPIPDGWSVLEVQCDINNNGFPVTLEPSWYQVINGNIYLGPKYSALTPTVPLVIIGKRQLTPSDYIPAYLTEFLLHLGMVYAFEMLKSSLTEAFVTNDVTMAEIINSIQTHEAKANKLRDYIATRWAQTW